MTRFRMIALSVAVVGVLAAGAVGPVASTAYAQPAVTNGQGGGDAGEPSWSRRKWNEWKGKWSAE